MPQAPDKSPVTWRRVLAWGALVGTLLFVADLAERFVLYDVTYHDRGSLLRFGTQTAVAGYASYPGNAANTLSNASGTTPGSGVTHWYQVFYRNAATGFCPPGTANWTNGLAVTWHL